MGLVGPAGQPALGSLPEAAVDRLRSNRPRGLEHEVRQRRVEQRYAYRVSVQFAAQFRKNNMVIDALDDIERALGRRRHDDLFDTLIEVGLQRLGPFVMPPRHLDHNVAIRPGSVVDAGMTSVGDVPSVDRYQPVGGMSLIYGNPDMS